MPPTVQLFHRIHEADSAAARRRVAALDLLERVGFRNVDFEKHRAALEKRGGAATPALWDGERLHVGIADVLAALDRIARHG